MPHVTLDYSSRVLTAFMESVVSVPNRPDLRYVPHAASRTGADISPARAALMPVSAGSAITGQAKLATTPDFTV